MREPDFFLDITGYLCPMTFVKTALRLERMAPGQTLAVRLNPGEALENVPRAARHQGHDVLEIAPEITGKSDAIHVILLRKGKTL